MAKVTSGQVGEYLKIGLYIGGAYLAYKAIKGLAETFGLIKTEAENKLDTGTDVASGDASILNTDPMIAFNGSYTVALIKAFNKRYKPKVFNGSYQLRMTPQEMAKRTMDLYAAKGYFNDDEEKVYGQFRNLQTAYQLSVMSNLFYTMYKADLLEWLKGFLNADEMEKIIDIVKNYNQFYTQP